MPEHYDNRTFPGKNFRTISVIGAGSLKRHARPMQHTWVKQRLRELGKTSRELARALGISPPRVSEMFAGNRAIDGDEVQKLARFLEMPVEWVAKKAAEGGLLEGSPVKLSEIDMEDRVDVPVASRMTKDVKVLGVAIGGSEGDFLINGEVVDRVRRPPALVDVKDAFALYLAGDSMAPRYEPGDLIYLNPARAPRPGDDVVIELLPERDGDGHPAYVKRLLRRSPTAVKVAQFNPQKEIEIPTKRIRAIYRVMSAAELLGV